MCFRVYRVYIAVGLLEFYSGTQYKSTRYTAENSVLQQVAIDMCSGIQQDREEVMYCNLTVNVLLIIS